MRDSASAGWMAAEQDRRIAEIFEREGRRLLNFIRKRVAETADAEDILQDVFYELVEAYRLMKPIEEAGAWLFQVARNRIIDRFRKKETEGLKVDAGDLEGEPLSLEGFLPAREGGPEAAYARQLLLDEIDEALEELPKGQREVFLAHEFEGRSFKDLSAETGVSVNTLLSRKRYAVLHLRRRLREIRDAVMTKEG